MNRKNFFTFEEAHKIVLDTTRAFGIDTERKWLNQKKLNYIRHERIPRNPEKAYKNKGWVSYAHWLGTNNIRGQLRKYNVNDKFFSRWSHEMSYVLGFWWADGYMRKRRGKYGYTYIFGISQKTDDKYILENILEKMGSNNPIYTPKSRPEGSHFEINSKNIFDDIVKLGGTPRKSKTIRLPNIPQEYIPDFIRGLFDGDGSISINGTHTPCSYICSGNIEFINDLKLLLGRFEIYGKIKSNQNKKSPCFLLAFSAFNTRKLGRFMYNRTNSIIKLTRKYEKFVAGGM